MSLSREVLGSIIRDVVAERDALRAENVRLRAVVEIARVAAEFVAWGQPERRQLLEAIAALEERNND